jgi:16S rRNA C967 or C1407 C5-methylase (RsmB/RsmF family)
LKVDTRALAARALAEIALRGVSLRDAMERHAPRLGDPRDRALLMALLSEGSRWWLRFDAAIDGLLEKPLRHKDPAIHALLVLGLVQLEILQLQDYAAVAATVEATRSLKRPQLAGLVNAVLRRWQRERETLNARLDAKPQTRHAHPAWLADALARDWPQQAEAVMLADNGEPPLMLVQNLMRLRLDAKLVIGDAGAPAGWWKRQPFDRILIDAPCSATGVLRRRPDVRLHRRESDIAAMHAQQQRILSALWPLLAPGGRLVYITCSVLRAENEAIVKAMLAAHADAQAVEFSLPVGQAASVGWQILPGDGDLDGMYYAVLRKQA